MWWAEGLCPCMCTVCVLSLFGMSRWSCGSLLGLISPLTTLWPVRAFPSFKCSSPGVGDRTAVAEQQFPGAGQCLCLAPSTSCFPEGTACSWSFCSLRGPSAAQGCAQCLGVQQSWSRAQSCWGWFFSALVLAQSLTLFFTTSLIPVCSAHSICN